MAAEIRTRRALDRDIARLADVCREYFKRNGTWPTHGTQDLLDVLSRLISAQGRGE